MDVISILLSVPLLAIWMPTFEPAFAQLTTSMTSQLANVLMKSLAQLSVPLVGALRVLAKLPNAILLMIHSTFVVLISVIPATHVESVTFARLMLPIKPSTLALAVAQLATRSLPLLMVTQLARMSTNVLMKL